MSGLIFFPYIVASKDLSKGFELKNCLAETDDDYSFYPNSSLSNSKPFKLVALFVLLTTMPDETDVFNLTISIVLFSHFLCISDC